MNRKVESAPKGQVLVLVALSIFVLVGFTALAVDGGNLYATRRKMQNAADAGALAGARQLCFEADKSFGAVESVAQEYAINWNLAEEAEVTVSDVYTVTVVARTTADTFFAGVIGWQEVDVAASASAMCTWANVGDNIWPVFAEWNQFDSIDCQDEIGELMFVFVPNNSQHNLYCSADLEELPDDFDAKKDDVCDCEGDDYHFSGPGGGTVTGHLASGQRGWGRLFSPLEPWDGDDNANSCGDTTVATWLEYGHPGFIYQGDCIPGKEGADISKNIQDAIDSYDDLSEAEKIRNLILYDGFCEDCIIAGEPGKDWPLKSCCTGNDYYRVRDFGCIEVVGYDENVTLPRVDPVTRVEIGTCNFKALIVRKRCGSICQAATGSGSGSIPDPDAVRAVRLID